MRGRDNDAVTCEMIAHDADEQVLLPVLPLEIGRTRQDALSVEEVVATTYEGPDLDPVYRRWRVGDQATRPGDPSGAENS